MVTNWEYKGYFVDRVQANDEYFVVPKPHPAAKKIATLYKNDILRIVDDQNHLHYARVQGYSTTRNNLDIQSLYSSNSLEEWHDSTNINLTDDFFKAIQGHYFVSINALWKKYSIRKISITVDGRERMLNNHASPDSGNYGGGAVPVF